MREPIFEARHRDALRRAVRVDCQVVADRGFRLIGSTTLDLSPGGLLVRGDAQAELGESAVVAFRTPGGRSWIDAEARITRIVHGRRASDPGPGIGLRFERMDAISRALLEASLYGLPPPVPARHPRRDYAGSIRAIARA